MIQDNLQFGGLNPSQNLDTTRYYTPDKNEWEIWDVVNQQLSCLPCNHRMLADLKSWSEPRISSNRLQKEKQQAIQVAKGHRPTEVVILDLQIYPQSPYPTRPPWLNIKSNPQFRWLKNTTTLWGPKCLCNVFK